MTPIEQVREALDYAWSYVESHYRQMIGNDNDHAAAQTKADLDRIDTALALLKDMESQEPVADQKTYQKDWDMAYAAALANREDIEAGDKTDAYMRGFLYARAHPSPSAPVEIAEVIAAGDHAVLMAERCIDGAHGGYYSFLPGQYRNWKRGYHAWTDATAKHRTT